MYILFPDGSYLTFTEARRFAGKLAELANKNKLPSLVLTDNGAISKDRVEVIAGVYQRELSRLESKMAAVVREVSGD